MRYFLETVIVIVFVLLMAAIPVGGVYWWMTSSCAERGEMEGYSITKVVATKCYGTNDGNSWRSIWY